MYKLFKLLNLNSKIKITDIGASLLDGKPFYEKLLDTDFFEVTAFEPQKIEYEKLLKKKKKNIKYLNYAIGDGSKKFFNICEYPGWSSIFTPSAETLESFPMYKKNATIKNTIQIETKRLDDIKEIEEIDYLKIDIQGGELDVFKNGRKKISNSLIVETEVPFINMYNNQPSFAAIDTELRNHKLVFHTFTILRKRTIAPFNFSDDKFKGINQITEGDVAYVKDFRNLNNLSETQIKKLCVLSHVRFKSYDLSSKCISVLIEKKILTNQAIDKYTEIINDEIK